VLKIFDVSKMPAIETTPTKSFQCSMDHVSQTPYQQWRLYLLVPHSEQPDTYAFLGHQQAILTFSDEQKKTFTLNLAPVLGAFQPSLSEFPLLEGQADQALFSTFSEELDIEFEANFISMDAELPTHVIGNLRLIDQWVKVIGQPVIELQSL
jgi:hypothetical protein